MSHRAIMITLAILALLVWAGLIVFVNQQPPLATNQAIFLVLIGVATSCTAMPISYLLNTRWSTSYSARSDLVRAIRQGLLMGLLSLILMALQLLHVLTWQTAAVLVLIAVLIEVMLLLRTHR